MTLPALRPAIVSAASVVFLFCATAFGIVLTLGGLRNATVETEIYLLTTELLRPPGRGRAVGRCSCVVVAGLLLDARSGCARCPTRASPGSAAPTAPARPRRPAGARDDRAAAGLVGAPDRRPGRRVAAGRTTAGAWRTTAALTTTGERQALLVPVTDALAISLRTAVDATWMSLSIGAAGRAGRDPPVAVAAPSAGSAAALDGLFMLPLGVSAVTLGFGFLITLDEPPLDLRDSPLLVPIAQALVALPLVVRTIVPVLVGHRRPAAPGRGLARRRAAAGAAHRRPAGGLEAAARRGRVRVRRLAGGVRRDRPSWPATTRPTLPVVIFQLIGHPGAAQLRHGAGRVRRPRRDHRRS